MAVVTGFVVDVLLSSLLGLLSGPTVDSLSQAPDLRRLDHAILLALSLLSTVLGGYVAGRIATQQQVLHGLLVGVIGVLLTQLPALGGPALPHLLILASAAGCLAGALGGLVSRYLPRRML